jgi:hypothetical protein
VILKLDEALKVDIGNERPVTKFPFYSNRLQTIDYDSIIAQGKPWKDPYFPAKKTAILDETMMR